MQEDRGRLLAALIRRTGDFALAEDCLQDALESALVHWARDGVPGSPRGWLLRTAQRKAIDRFRRAKRFEQKQDQYAQLLAINAEADEQPPEDSDIPDERLRLIFTCCHPALAEKTRVALTLRALGGLTTRQIASAFVDQEPAMAQRLVRARQKIDKAGIPYELPDRAQWPARLNSVLEVVYLIFNEGYVASSGEVALRTDLCVEAIRLARLLDQLQPEEPEIEGLLALLLLTRARFGGRSEHRFIPLSEQDRGTWDPTQIREGRALVARALDRRRAGPYQIQAAISALHAEAVSHESTDWSQIVLLYETLQGFTSNPVIALNRAVALSYAEGPALGLQALLPLAQALASYRGYHAAEADLRRRLGQEEAARQAYERAIAAKGNAVDRAFLQERLATLGQP
jgi:RNA polymerase sigma-70 factor (ECF subfamily)